MEKINKKENKRKNEYKSTNRKGFNLEEYYSKTEKRKVVKKERDMHTDALHYKTKIVEADLPKLESSALVDIANSNIIRAEADLYNGKIIEGAILENTEALSILMHQKDKNDAKQEYFRYIEMIEKYERILRDKGNLSEVYRKIKRIPRLVITEDEEQILLNRTTEVIEKVLKLASFCQKDIIECVAEVLWQQDYDNYINYLKKLKPIDRMMLDKEYPQLNYYIKKIKKEKKSIEEGYISKLDEKYIWLQQKIEEINDDIALKNAKIIYERLSEEARK